MINLENLLASTRIAAILLDDEFKIRDFTAATKNIYNIQPADIGRSLFELGSHAQSMPPYPPLTMIQSGKSSETEVILPDGQIFLRRTLPHTTVANRRDGIVVIFIDVTNLRSKEARFFNFANYVPVMTWTTKANGDVEFFNSRWYEYTGQRPDVAEGWGWRAVLHPDDAKPSLRIWQHSIDTGEDYYVEYRLRRHDGVYRWHSGSGIPVRNDEGQILNWFGTCVDIHDRKEKVEILRQSEAHFRSLVDNSPAVMWMTDKNAKCTYLSRQWYEMTGRTPQQDLGNAWIENVHPDDREAAEKAFTVSESKGPISVRYRVRHKNKHYRWVVDSGLPLTDEDGKFCGYIGTVVDIHDQVASEKKLNEVKDRFDRSVTATELGVWHCDLPLNVINWNKEVKKHLLIAPDDQLTMDKFYEHVHEMDRVRIQLAVENSVGHGAPYDVTYRTIDPADRSKMQWVRAIGWTDCDETGHPTRFDGITIDVTNEYRRQEELRLAKEEAEKARQIAQNANISKTRFLANMSHEIRTPLSAIVGFGELLQSHLSENSEANTFIERITRNAVHLNHLVDELLDLSKIEAEKLEIDLLSVELDTLLESIFSNLILRAQEKGLALKYFWSSPKPLRIITDPIRFSQILTNIIGNAVKFTEKGSIDVEFHLKNNRLVIRVKDSGIGLSADHVGRIFEPFMQADSSVTRKYGGTGLGLSLSKKLTQLLGGNLFLENSVPGQGSIFRIEIKAQTDNQVVKLTENLTRTEKPDALLLKGKRILVVDDAPDNRILVNLFLKQTGAETVDATNGLEAVQLAEKSAFDVVLMDIQMPVMDGYKALSRLKEIGYQAPVIALTAHAFKEERERCLAAGFSTFLSKPINRNQLIETLESQLRIKS